MRVGEEIAEELLRRLGEIMLDDGCVISLYLNLDPAEYGTAPARASAIRSVLDELSRRVRAIGGISHSTKAALREDVARIEGYFADDFDASGMHGLAIFAAKEAELFEIVPLARPPESQVAVDISPQVGPLIEASVEGRWLILLVSRRDARLLHGTPERVVEVAGWSDQVHGHHDQGGLSQARYQRSVEEQVEEHLRQVGKRLARISRHPRYEHLLVGCTEELWPQVEAQLDDFARERLVGRVDVDVRDATAEEVLEVTRPAMEETERRRESALLERLEEELSMQARGRKGLEEVLTALHERRVEVLVLDAGFTCPGVMCHACGWMGASGQQCPIDGESLIARENIAEDAIAAAVTSDAQIVPVHAEDSAPVPEGIAALLRF